MVIASPWEGISINDINGDHACQKDEERSCREGSCSYWLCISIRMDASLKVICESKDLRGLATNAFFLSG